MVYRRILRGAVPQGGHHGDGIFGTCVAFLIKGLAKNEGADNERRRNAA